MLCCVTDLSYPDSSPQSKTGVHHELHCLHKLSIKLVTPGPSPQSYKNTFIRQTIPGTQSSSPRGWPRAIPEVRFFLEMCRV